MRDDVYDLRQMAEHPFVRQSEEWTAQELAAGWLGAGDLVDHRAEHGHFDFTVYLPGWGRRVTVDVKRSLERHPRLHLETAEVPVDKSLPWSKGWLQHVDLDLVFFWMPDPAEAWIIDRAGAAELAQRLRWPVFENGVVSRWPGGNLYRGRGHLVTPRELGDVVLDHYVHPRACQERPAGEQGILL